MNPLQIGDLRLESSVILAPMAGYTDLPFRLSVRSLGGLGLAFTEMLNPDSLIHAKSRKKLALIATSPEDRPLGYQIYGKEPDRLVAGAQWLETQGAKLLDINMGCPQRKISGRGAGAGLLRTPEKAVEIARRVVESVRVPVTVKIRLGWETNTAVDLAVQLEQAGVAAITVHGRTRAQGFAGRSDCDGIRSVVVKITKIPVVANGDVVSVESARDLFKKTGCAGIMIGRCALKDPWLIRDIVRDLAGQAPLPSPSREERVDFMMRHFERSTELYGEKDTVFLFRKWVPQYLKGLEIGREVLAELQQIADATEWKRRVPQVMLAGTSNLA